MKKSILFAMFLGGVIAANAQTNTDNVALSVTLKPIQTLVVNASQSTIDLEYSTVNDYEDGVSSSNADHLTIYSTGGFQVKVNSTADNLSKGLNVSEIAAETLTVTPTAGAREIKGSPTYTSVTLTENPKVLISSAQGGFDRTISVKYAGATGQVYMNNYETGKTNIYTTTVTYSILPQ